MANIRSENDKFIIIGVIEKNGTAIEFNDIVDFHDQANYQTYLNEYIEPEISFEYKPFNFKNHKLAYFRVFASSNQPYLFKKELSKNCHKIDIGSGFIRSGTSTRRLKRSDFEIIYESRYKAPDRKDHVVVLADIQTCEDEELENNGFLCMVVDIANRSNKSIELGIENKVYKSNDYEVDAAENLKLRWRDERFQRQQAASFRSFSPEIWMPHPTVTHANNTDHVLFSEAELKVRQSDSEKDVFDQQIVIAVQKPCVIMADVIIRSDDFTDGILIHPIKIPVDISR